MGNLRRRGMRISRKNRDEGRHIMQISVGSLPFQNSGKEITKSGESHISGLRQIHSDSMHHLYLSKSFFASLTHTSPLLLQHSSLHSHFSACDFQFPRGLICHVQPTLSAPIQSRIPFCSQNSLDFQLLGFTEELEQSTDSGS